jgi:hypothetical protein
MLEIVPSLEGEAPHKNSLPGSSFASHDGRFGVTLPRRWRRSEDATRNSRFGKARSRSNLWSHCRALSPSSRAITSAMSRRTFASIVSPVVVYESGR